MKKPSFLSKLYKQEKLKLVEPSEILKNSYIHKSESNLASSKILLENNRLEESVYLAYYSMYNMLTALFFKVGIKCENHTAAILLLKDLFGLDNTSISFAKGERIDKQYYTDFNILQTEVVQAIHSAEGFNKLIFDFISKLNSDSIKEFRTNLNNLINITN